MFKPMLKKFMLSLFLIAVVLSMFPVRAFADVNIHESANLLKNPSFEEYTEFKTIWRTEKSPNYWNNDYKYWTVMQSKIEKSNVRYDEPVDGNCYVSAITTTKYDEDADIYKHSKLYQDVDVSGYNTGTVFMLSGSMSGWYDQAVMSLQFVDVSGKILASKSVGRRDKGWKHHSIILPKPETAVTARVVLMANLMIKYSSNEVFFDALDLRVTDRTYRKVVISGKSSSKWGETVQLSVNNGISKNPSDFTWWCDMESLAEVDSKGRVKLNFVQFYEDGVTIYAEDSEGNIGSFFMSNGGKKAYIEPDVISEQNNTGTGGTQTPNTNTNTGGTQTPNTNTTVTPNTNKGKKVKTVSGVKVRQTGNAVYLNWKKYKGADYYLLHGYDFSKKKWKVMGFASKDQTSGQISGLKKYSEYWYKLTAEKQIESGSKTLATTKIIKVKIK